MPDELPRIDLLQEAVDSRELVLVAHGGAMNSQGRASAWWPGVIRARQFAKVAMKYKPAASVGLLRYRVRGWNGDAADSWVDLESELRRVPDGFSVALIGHSLGARTVLRSANSHGVVGTLALSPWLPRDEVLVPPTAPCAVLVAGTKDRSAIVESRAYVRESRRAGASLAHFEVDGAGHSFLTRDDAVERIICEFLDAAVGNGSKLITDAMSGDAARPPDILRSTWSAA